MVASDVSLSVSDDKFLEDHDHFLLLIPSAPADPGRVLGASLWTARTWPAQHPALSGGSRFLASSTRCCFFRISLHEEM